SESVKPGRCADLYRGMSWQGEAATGALAERVADAQAEVFAIAGDVGEGEAFARCLELFAPLPHVRLLIPGNHDLWTRDPAPGASLELYEERLPAVAARPGLPSPHPHPSAPPPP